MKPYLLTVLIFGTASILCAQDEDLAFRRFEIHISPMSVIRVEGVTAIGAQLGFGYRLNEVVGIVADIDAHRSNDSIKTEVFAVRAGPRFYARYGSRTTLFGHALIGSGQIERSAVSGGVKTSQTVRGFSMTLGTGVDVGIKPWFAVRAMQLDYDNFRIRGVTGDGFRASTGVVFRVGR